MPLERRKFGAGNEQNENRFVVPYSMKNTLAEKTLQV